MSEQDSGNVDLKLKQLVNRAASELGLGTTDAMRLESFMLDAYALGITWSNELIKRALQEKSKS